MSTILSINNLSKNYGVITAVNQLNLEVKSGQVFGLLGPNGSGKTTTLGIILGITNASGGSYEWFGGSAGKYHRKKLGALLETPNFYPYLDADKNLEIVAQIKDKTRTQKELLDEREELLELVNLKRRRKSKFKTYSLGMKQRLAIAGAMIGNPEVLIFDEPTNGLDPQGIAEIRTVVNRIADMGKTIIMASHILDEVEKTCSEVAIIKNGHLLASGSVGSILNKMGVLEIGANDLETLGRFLTDLKLFGNIKKDNGLLIAELNEAIDTATINQKAFEAGIALNHLVERKRRLEEEFLAITS